MIPPLFPTKLQPPQLLAHSLPRPALVAKIAASLTQKLLLVTAPAGYGKSTTLATWAHNAPVPVAWLTLDEADNQPARGAGHLLAAIQRVAPGVGQPAWALLKGGQELTSTTLATTLAHALAENDTPLVLVLDDYHLLTQDWLQQTVQLLVEQTPPTVRLILSSRTQPPLPLARWRARRLLAELTLHDLRFSADETNALFAQSSPRPLAPAAIARLQHYTEGWITGLQLALLALRHQADPEGFVQDFTGAHHYIVDYLGQEVVRQQSASVQHFLTHTAVLEELTGDLCAWLTGEANAQAQLEALEHAGLFLVALDGERRWFRYHLLFRDFLRTHLQQRDPQLAAALHRRAAHWFAAQGNTATAVEHSLAAGDGERVAQLVEQVGDRLWTHHEMTLIQRWVGALPDTLTARYPKAWLLYAWANLILGQLDNTATTVATVTQQIKRQPPPDPATLATCQGICALLEAALALPQDPAKAVQQYGEAATLLPPQARNWQSAVYIGRGFAQLALNQLSEAGSAFEAGALLSRQIGNEYGAVYSLYQLGQVRWAQARLGDAVIAYGQGIQLASEGRPEPLPIVAWPYLGLGVASLEQNQLAEAAQHLLAALRWARVIDDADALTPILLALAQLELIGARWANASDLVEQAQQIAQAGRARNGPDLRLQVQLAQIRLWLAQDQRQAVLDWVDEMTARAGNQDEGWSTARLIMLARVRLHTGRPGAALADLAKAESAVTPRRLLLEIHLVRARAYLALRQRNEARKWLDGVVHHAAREEMRRLLLDEPALRPLLDDARLQLVEPAFLQELLAQADDQTRSLPLLGQALVEPFSRVELEILRLLAAGHSNQTIAETRLVAITTVKWHLKNIYGKLGVRSRTAALARAHALGLLA